MRLEEQGRSVLDGFGLLSGQNGPPEGEQGAQPSRPSWRGRFGGFGPLSGQNGAPGRDRDRDLRLFHRPRWTQRLYLCLLSLFLAVLLACVSCVWLLSFSCFLWRCLSVRSCLDIPDFLGGQNGPPEEEQGAQPKFSDHFLYARDASSVGRGQGPRGFMLVDRDLGC